MLKSRRILYSILALGTSPLHAATEAQIQLTVEGTRVPMMCGKFFVGMSTGASLTQAQSSKLQEYANQLIVNAGDVAANKLGPLDQQTTRELAERLHTYGESEYRKVMDSIQSIQDPKARNEKITQVADACMGVLKKIGNR